jgi:hypothetical protein
MLSLFDPCISRKEQRLDITPDLLAHSEPTIFLGKCLYQVRNVLFFSCSLIENSDGWASYRFCLFLWTFPFECALESVPLLLTLFGSANRSGVMSNRCSCKHYFLQKFFCKEGAHCTSCYVAVGFFFLVLQNRTIGFEINYIALNDKVQKWRNFSKNC